MSFSLFSAFSNKELYASEKYLCALDVTILEGNSISFCQGQFITINASAGFSSYSWSGPQNGSTPSLLPASSGEYVITATDAVGCISSDTIDVTVFINPIGVIVSSEGNQFCPGSTGTTLSLTQPFASYLWDNSSTASSIQVDQGGTYVVQVIDFNGCVGNSAITIMEPNFQLNAPSSVCLGTSCTLTASGGTLYSWSTGDTGPIVNVTPTVPTNYSVTITNGICVQTLNQIITLVEIPYVAIEDTFYIAQGEHVTLIAPEGYLNYSWNPTTNLSATNMQQVSFSGSQTTVYEVNSTHTNGCARIDAVVVIVLDLTIPTGFSPNNDNVNDTFVIPELYQYRSSLAIFNRWGDKVYESDHYQNDWDGTCQSKLCAGNSTLPEGTYFYSIDIENVHFDGYTTLKK